MELCSACKKSLSFGINGKCIACGSDIAVTHHDEFGKCLACGRDMPVSHHEGYADSVTVRWLCLACHSTHVTLGD